MKIPRVEFHKVTFAEGIEFLQGKKIVPRPEMFSRRYPLCGNHASYAEEVVFFDDGTAMTLVSDWDRGYYGDVYADDPLFFIGKVVYED